jgi:hypothetical protein
MTTDQLYQQWLIANSEKNAYYKEHYGRWNAEVDSTYKALDTLSESLYYEYLASKMGGSPAEVRAAAIEKIHSRYD